MGSDADWGVPILIADGDADCRGFVAAQLERIGFTPHEASTGHEALALAESVRPALVILDVSLPGITGYEVCHELRDRFGEDLALVFVSGARVEPIDRVAGLLIGADDYLVKPFDPDELLVRVRALLRRRNDRSKPSGNSAFASLTAREREVLAQLAQGRTQSEIADDLFISSKTVGSHIQRVLSKLGVHSRAQAVTFAHQHGLLDAEVDAQVTSHTLAAAPLPAD